MDRARLQRRRRYGFESRQGHITREALLSSPMSGAFLNVSAKLDGAVLHYLVYAVQIIHSQIRV